MPCWNWTGSVLLVLSLFSVSKANLPDLFVGKERPVLQCRVYVFHTFDPAQEEPQEDYQCAPIEDGEEMDVSYSFSDSSFFQDVTIESGSSLFVSVEGDFVIRDHSVLELNSATISLLPQRVSRNTEINERTFGVKDFLVLRVSTLDAQVVNTAEELADFTFNLTEHTMRSQFLACSIGQLDMRPASLEGVTNGVLEVFVNVNASDTSHVALGNLAVEEATRQLGLDTPLRGTIDYAMLCIPPGTGSWTGYAGVGHWKSHQNNGLCASLSAAMHEVGHNLGVAHAWKNGRAYRDYTGYQGSVSRSVHAPTKCYNGPFSWEFGWYHQHHYEFDPFQGPQLLTIASATDYNILQDDEYVIVRVHDEAQGGYYYWKYNLAVGFNSGTGASRNMLTMHFMEYTTFTSHIIGDFDETVGPYPFPNFNGTSMDLIVDVCSKQVGDNGTSTAASMRVSIGFQSLCGLEPEVGAAPPPKRRPGPSRTKLKRKRRRRDDRGRLVRRNLKGPITR